MACARGCRRGKKVYARPGRSAASEHCRKSSPLKKKCRRAVGLLQREAAVCMGILKETDASWKTRSNAPLGRREIRELTVALYAGRAAAAISLRWRVDGRFRYAGKS